MRCQYPWPLKVVRFIEDPLLFSQLNISGADISCALKNDVAEAARSMQPVTLYITINIVPRDLRLALARAYQDMKRFDRSNSWQGAVGKIKWVMDTLSPIAEVRVIPL
jgi:hypothetical protein